MAKRSMLDVQQILGTMENLLRTARISEARALVADINPKKLDNPQAAHLGGMLQRMGFQRKAQVLLRRRLKADLEARVETRELWLEYAFCLAQANANTGALRILADPGLRGCPLRFLYQGIAYFNTRNLAQAENSLEKFLAAKNQSEYLQYVARILLTRVLDEQGRFEAALEIVAILDKQLSETKYTRIMLGNLESALQIYAQKGNSELFTETIRRIEKFKIEKAYPASDLYTRYWKAYVELRQNPENAMRLFRALREDCLEVANSEAVRDIDLQIAKFSQDRNLLQRLWFGSPFAQFREKMGYLGAAPFLLEIGEPRAGAAAVKLNWPLAGISPLLQRFFAAVLLDLYRKPNIEELFERLYPDAYFNPFTSPIAVRQVVHRFRNKMSELQIDLTVVQKNGLYWFESKSGYVFSLDCPCWEILEKSPLELQLQELSKELGRKFTSQEFANAGKIPLRNAQILLKKMSAAGYISRYRQTRGSYYEIRL